tara:strand:- start:442 stop:1059 length:618 start_codon:yes stop_codon:yes gene_type:complete
MLLANNLSFSRNNKEIFNDLNLSISPNKIVHIAGRNGIGKTTLIKILANVLIPKTGEIYWNGKSLKKNIKEFLNNLTYIMDIQTSKNEMTVFENTFFWKKLFSSKIKEKELDSIFNLLSLNRHSKVSFLSRGEIKKLELCRLVIEQKKFWLLDEPYAGLDKSSIELINETFKNHIESGGMIIFSSHFNPELQNMETIQLENYANY